MTTGGQKPRFPIDKTLPFQYRLLLMVAFFAFTGDTAYATGNAQCNHIVPDNPLTNESTLQTASQVVATCAVKGHVECWECTVCDKLYPKTAEEQAGASISEEEITPATAPTNHPEASVTTFEAQAKDVCKQAGWPAYKECTTCQKFFTVADTATLVDSVAELADYEAPDSHNIDTVAAKAATCKADGNKAHYTCTICKNKFSDEEATVIFNGEVTIDALAHKKEGVLQIKDAEKAATCTDKGVKEGYWQCTMCDVFGTYENNEFSEALSTEEYETAEDSTNHANVEEKKAETPDCTKNYLMVDAKYCNDCKNYVDEKGEDITSDVLYKEKDAHNFVEVAANPATCAKDGYTAGVWCSVCHAEGVPGTAPVVILATDKHNYTDTVLLAPTCTETGVMKQYCSVCKTTTYKTFGPHNYGEGKVTRAATCGKDGVMTYTCPDCKEVCTEKINKTGKHTFKADTTVPPTCTEAGMIGNYCTVCGEPEDPSDPGETDSKNNEPLGHDYKYVVFKAPEHGKNKDGSPIAEAGIAKYQCTRCDAYEKTGMSGEDKTTDIDVPHVWSEKMLDANCVAAQRVERTCTICGTEETEDVIGGKAALGTAHTEPTDETKVVTTNMVCGVRAGTKTYTCTVCKEKILRHKRHTPSWMISERRSRLPI